MEQKFRSHTCGEIDSSQLGQKVTLCGWVAKRRDHGGLIFIDLRDRYGITQLVFDPKLPEGGAKAHETASALRSEFVITCQGTVRRRPEGMSNAKLRSGEIEIACARLEILSEAKTPPFAIEDEVEVAEMTRLKYRYLDLRRPSLQSNLMIRHRMLASARRYLDEQNFVEVETPILYKSTPEGARDFIVPSRLNRGDFYALPQSPQTLKQLLMISGLDRYYQVARCFRDEDLRADRQPEFSQIDIESSFLSQDEFLSLQEGMIARIWKELRGQELKLPFARMPYFEAMDRFGSDKPDVRFGLELQNVSDVFKSSSFQVFQKALTTRGSVRAIVVPSQAAEFSRKDLDDLQAHAASYGAQGLLWIKVLEDLQLQSPASKFFSESEKQSLFSALKLKAGDLVLMVADARNKVVFDSLGALRLKLAERLRLVPEDGREKPAFLWVVNFPLLEFDEKEGRYMACHHPFTSPRPEFFDNFIQGKELDRVEASAYDLVLNGVEIGGGSLRIYRPDVQAAMFRTIGLSASEAEEKFGFFLEALQYGTPPHGGIAYGVDRLAAILCGVGPIRDVMAFPKTQKGHCLMSGSPSRVNPEQLAELGISHVQRS